MSVSNGSRSARLVAARAPDQQGSLRELEVLLMTCNEWGFDIFTLRDVRRAWRRQWPG